MKEIVVILFIFSNFGLTQNIDTAISVVKLKGQIVNLKNEKNFRNEYVGFSQDKYYGFWEIDNNTDFPMQVIKTDKKGNFEIEYYGLERKKEGILWININNSSFVKVEGNFENIKDKDEINLGRIYFVRFDKFNCENKGQLNKLNKSNLISNISEPIIESWITTYCDFENGNCEHKEKSVIIEYYIKRI